MRPGAARLQGWRRLAPPLPLALTMRHEQGSGGHVPGNRTPEVTASGSAAFGMGLGPLQKRPQREELVSLLRVQTPREAGSPPPGRGSPPAPGAASEKHLLFTSHSTCGDTRRHFGCHSQVRARGQGAVLMASSGQRPDILQGVGQPPTKNYSAPNMRRGGDLGRWAWARRPR